MNMIHLHIEKLINDFGVTKQAIARTLGISYQSMDYRVEKKVEFSPEEIRNFYKKYGALLN